MRYLLTSKSAQLLKTLLVSTCCLAAFNTSLEAKANTVDAFTYFPTGTLPSGAPNTGTAFSISTADNYLGFCQLTAPVSIPAIGTVNYNSSCVGNNAIGSESNSNNGNSFTSVAYLPPSLDNYFAVSDNGGNINLCNITFGLSDNQYTANGVVCPETPLKGLDTIHSLAYNTSDSLLYAAVGSSSLYCFVTENGACLPGIFEPVEFLGTDNKVLGTQVSNISTAPPKYSPTQSAYTAYNSSATTGVLLTGLSDNQGNFIYQCNDGYCYSIINNPNDPQLFAFQAIGATVANINGVNTLFIATAAPNPGNVNSIEYELYQCTNASNINDCTNLNWNGSQITNIAYSPQPANLSTPSSYTNGVLLIGTANSSYIYAYSPVNAGSLNLIFTNNGDNGEFNGPINSLVFDENGNVLIQYGPNGLDVANPFVTDQNVNTVNTLIAQDADSSGNLNTDNILKLVLNGVGAIGKIASSSAAAPTSLNSPVTTPEPSTLAGLSLLVGLGLLSRKHG